MQKNTSSRAAKLAQRTAIAAVVIAGGVFGISAWAEKQAQTLETPGQAAPVSEAKLVSNLVPNHGQEDPLPMVTEAAHFVGPANDGATSADPVVRGEYLARGQAICRGLGHGFDHWHHVLEQHHARCQNLYWQLHLCRF